MPSERDGALAETGVEVDLFNLTGVDRRVSPTAGYISALEPEADGRIPEGPSKDVHLPGQVWARQFNTDAALSTTKRPSFLAGSPSTWSATMSPRTRSSSRTNSWQLDSGDAGQFGDSEALTVNARRDLELRPARE